MLAIDTNNIHRDLRADTAGRLLMRPVDSAGVDLGVPSNIDTAALVTLAAAAAGGNSAEQINLYGRGLQLSIDITVITGTGPTLTVSIQGKDPVSGKWYTLLQSAALSAVALTNLTVYPGVTAAANVAASQVIPRTWRVLYSIGGTTPAVTATIGASVIL